MVLHTRLEALFLKIFRNTVLVLMLIAILAIPTLLATAAYKFFYHPGAAPSTEHTLSKEFDVSKFKDQLLSEAGKKTAQGDQDSPKPSSPQQNNTPLYKEKALAIYNCGDQFRKATGAELEATSQAQVDQQIENIRSFLVNRPKSSRDEYVNGLSDFACKVLQNPEIIALKKDGKIGPVLVPAVNAYTKAWEEAAAQNREYEAAELQKVGIYKTEVFILFSTAASLFFGFMMLALYLIFSKIESNLSGINGSIERFSNK